MLRAPKKNLGLTGGSPSTSRSSNLSKPRGNVRDRSPACPNYTAQPKLSLAASSLMSDAPKSILSEESQRDHQSTFHDRAPGSPPASHAACAVAPAAFVSNQSIGASD